MRILKGAVAFIIAFCMLTATVVCAAVVSDEALVSDAGALISDETQEPVTESETVSPTENYDIAPFSDIDITDEGATGYAARMHAPKKDNPYYYSDLNVFYKWGWGMPNCTAYAWGRAYEILKEEPKLCIYDAYMWYDYNKEHGYYKYGQTPKLGAIACYKYIGYNSGHVAVVEKIIGDTVYFSNSAYSGQEFYVNSTPIDSPEDALYNSIFLGYIYIGEFSAGEDNSKAYKITSDDGVNIRSGAGTSYSIVGAIPHGKTVFVTKTAKANGYNWGYTTYNGVTGWFVIDFAELIDESGKEPEKPTEPEKPIEPEILIGDVDQDSSVTIIDSTLIQMYMASIESLTEEQKALADVDGDGDVSVLDSTKIRLYLAGLE
ncbi:MAG: CHAP domain-containing protein [Ruminococcus sp.]|nr:CHAP domain-containing protein [Ruminococcus sp.]